MAWARCGRPRNQALGRIAGGEILKDEYNGDPHVPAAVPAEADTRPCSTTPAWRCFDYGEDEGSAFLVMELAPGRAAVQITTGRSRWTRALCSTTSARRCGPCGRPRAGSGAPDVKPGNLIHHPDTGSRSRTSASRASRTRCRSTATGQVMGTAQYLAPEQATGQTATGSSDIYSLGIIGYELLAGRRPFTGESQIVIALAQVNDNPRRCRIRSGTGAGAHHVHAGQGPRGPARETPASCQRLDALRRGDVASAATMVPGTGPWLSDTGLRRRPAHRGDGPGLRLSTRAMPGTAGWVAAVTSSAAAARTARHPRYSAHPSTAQFDAAEQTRGSDGCPEEGRRSVWAWPPPRSRAPRGARARGRAVFSTATCRVPRHREPRPPPPLHPRRRTP
ncbi:hypothetical protein QJS66_11685 [Kocuria rhizophila]|nr:hypothetical protein QJS66_11685 [Kocuria rhizophila]